MEVQGQGRTAKGYLMLVLHAHLPFVKHPEYSQCLEESWLFEAMAECYIPLLLMMDRLNGEKTPWKLTMTISPTLSSMLSDDLLQERFLKYLENLQSLVLKELERTRWEPEFHELANFYHQRLRILREHYFQLDCNLLKGFRRHYEMGNLELITCSATHAFLPYHQNDLESINAQLQLGIQEFENQFCKRPRGIWLPECGYFPGLESILEKAGIEYFFVDTHGIVFSEPRPRYGVYAPLLCRNSNVKAFARDSECSRQVWSSLEGYPGDYAYRDFYSDIGFELDYEYLKPHLHPLGVRTMTGLKYRRVTGASSIKKAYQREVAIQKAQQHANHFVNARQQQAEWLEDAMDGTLPLFVAPYDAELFGHWWFEGPEWIECVIRNCQPSKSSIYLTNYPDYSKNVPLKQTGTMPYSSWGQNGYGEVWLDPSNDWIYFHLQECATEVWQICKNNKGAVGQRKKALNQLIRELLLAQSSDWPFILKANTVPQYATKRLEAHILNSQKLIKQISQNQIDELELAEMERSNGLFPYMDFEKLL